MTRLPNQVSGLGTLTLVEVLMEYDGPKLFVASNEFDSYFLALWVHEASEDTGWLYVPISETRLDAIRTGNLDLRTAFADPEQRWLYYVDEPANSREPLDVRFQSAENVPPTWLPAPGIRLHDHEQVDGFNPEEVRQEAIARHDLISAFRLDSPSRATPRFPLRSLGPFLSSVQEVVDVIAYHLNVHYPAQRGPIPMYVLDRVGMDFTGATAGSFVIAAAPEDRGQLPLYDPLLEESLEALAEFLSAADDEDADSLPSVLRRWDSRVTSKLLALLEEVNHASSGLDVTFANPQGYLRRAVLRREGASRAMRIVSQYTPGTSQEYTVLGTLVGANLRTKIYELQDDERGKLSGRIADDVLPRMEGLLGLRVSGTVREETEVVALTGEERVRRILVSVGTSEEGA